MAFVFGATDSLPPARPPPLLPAARVTLPPAPSITNSRRPWSIPLPRATPNGSRPLVCSRARISIRRARAARAARAAIAPPRVRRGVQASIGMRTALCLRAVMRTVRRVHLRRRGEGSLGSLVSVHGQQ